MDDQSLRCLFFHNSVQIAHVILEGLLSFIKSHVQSVPYIYGRLGASDAIRTLYAKQFEISEGLGGILEGLGVSGVVCEGIWI